MEFIHAELPANFADSLLAAIGDLIVGCLLGGFMVGSYILLHNGDFSFQILVAGWAIGSFFIAVIAAMYDVLLALLYGAPTYTLLNQMRLRKLFDHINYRRFSFFGTACREFRPRWYSLIVRVFSGMVYALSC
ncbi:hypothetical protein [Acinetobacter higginsii]|uniref:hypothetical protein n=1 Tax=Acinetobacter higginsii TaxID=70347 RepID=UPI001F4B9EF6|nr:hypothetical protein [Acinetobacter higginsii]MCH7296941.1 hypothetical protein [Acinetobacter higginsii]